ncbi:DUSP9 [Symbiodinium sp. CCMP2592]|nr:DUSP9 [Symbiodinium sp. CCMP2592]
MAPIHAITLDNVDEIVENLYLGGITAAHETENLVEQGIRAVVCCVRETEFPSYDFNKQIHYFRVDVEDVSIEPIEYFWPEAMQFIHEHHSKGLPVFVHCRAGVSRSASTVIAYLVSQLGFTLKDAFLLAHKKRPVVTPNLGFMDKLCELEKSIKGTSSIDLFKYESWWSGSHMAEVPDVGIEDLEENPEPEKVPEAEEAEEAEAASPSSPSGRSSVAQKLQAANRKLRILRAMSDLEHQKQVLLDLPEFDDGDPPVQRKRIERIRALLIRQAAHDPELGYCQGMHLSAAIFVAASESQGEAYWRFHGFTTALRGLWLGSSSFPLLRSGCACFQEGSKKEELAKGRPWFQHLMALKIDLNLYLAQAWLGLFGLWLPFSVLVQCIQLLEGSHMAGLLAMTLALLDRRSDRMHEAQTEDGLLRVLLSKEDISAREILQETRKNLAEASIALKQNTCVVEEAELTLTMRNSRVFSDERKILEGLPSLSELVLQERVEPEVTEIAPVPRQDISCWSCLEAFRKPKESPQVAKRAGASVHDQNQELAKMRSFTHATIRREARQRLSRLNWADQTSLQK